MTFLDDTNNPHTFDYLVSFGERRIQDMTKVILRFRGTRLICSKLVDEVCRRRPCYIPPKSFYQLLYRLLCITRERFSTVSLCMSINFSKSAISASRGEVLLFKIIPP